MAPESCADLFASSLHVVVYGGIWVQWKGRVQEKVAQCGSSEGDYNLRQEMIAFSLTASC